MLRTALSLVATVVLRAGRNSSRRNVVRRASGSAPLTNPAVGFPQLLDHRCHSSSGSSSSSSSSSSSDDKKSNNNGTVSAADAAADPAAAAAIVSDKKIVVDLVKRHDYDSFLIGLCLPGHVRSAFYALRAFNIELALAQSNARESPLAAQIRLKFWSDTVDGLFPHNQHTDDNDDCDTTGTAAATETGTGDAGSDLRFERTPVSQALAFAVRNNGLDRYWLDRMLHTRKADALREHRAWTTLDEVETFSEGVYSSMMYATADLFQDGCDHTETALGHIGIAHGMMQMLLAVPGCIPAGGYLGLPSTLFRKPLDPARNTAQKEDVVAAVRAVCLAIDDHLRAAKELVPSVPKVNRPLLLQAVPVGLYLRQFEKNGFDPFWDTRAEVSLLKMQLALKFRSLVGSYF